MWLCFIFAFNCHQYFSAAIKGIHGTNYPGNKPPRLHKHIEPSSPPCDVDVDGIFWYCDNQYGVYIENKVLIYFYFYHVYDYWSLASGDKPLSEPMMAWCTDAYMRHLASMGYLSVNMYRKTQGGVDCIVLTWKDLIKKELKPPRQCCLLMIHK